MLEVSQWSLNSLSNELLSLDLEELWVLLLLLGQILVGESTSGPLADDEELIILHLEKPVDTLGKNEAVGLSVHGLWTEGGGHQVDLLALELLKALRKVQEFDLDSSVLLWENSLTL